MTPELSGTCERGEFAEKLRATAGSHKGDMLKSTTTAREGVVRTILIACALALGGCAAYQQAQFEKARNEALAAYSKCLADNVASPEGQVVYKRLWMGNSDTVAAKLTDPKPLTQPEKDALVVVHSRGLECRKIGDTWDSQHSIATMPYAAVTPLTLVALKLLPQAILSSNGSSTDVGRA
jgi:hypothetical protein